MEAPAGVYSPEWERETLSMQRAERGVHSLHILHGNVISRM